MDEDGVVSVVTPWEALGGVSDALKEAGLEPEHADVDMVPSTTTPLDKEGAEKVLRLVDALEDLDDVQNVYSNAELPDDLFEDE